MTRPSLTLFEDYYTSPSTVLCPFEKPGGTGYQDQDLVPDGAAHLKPVWKRRNEKVLKQTNMVTMMSTSESFTMGGRREVDSLL